MLKASALHDWIPVPVDCCSLINRQLDDIVVLISRLRDSRSEASKSKLFSKICNKAVLHVQSREHVMIPAWRRIRWKEFPLASFQAHVRLKRALAELIISPPNAQGHAAAIDDFAGRVNHQRMLDRDHLVPMLRSSMQSAEIRELCNEIERLFAADVDFDEPCGNSSPSERLQEAALVLRSLAVHRKFGRNGASLESVQA